MLTKIPEIMKAQRYSWIVDAELNWRKNKRDRAKIDNILRYGIIDGIGSIKIINTVIERYSMDERKIMWDMIKPRNPVIVTNIKVLSPVIHIHSYDIIGNGYEYGMEV